MSFKSLTLGVVVFLLSVSVVLGDTIYLKNGQVIQGQIISQDKDRVKFRSATGELIIEKNAIRRITYGDAPEKAPDEAKDQEAKQRLEEQKRLEAEKDEKEKAELERLLAEKEKELERIKKECAPLKAEADARAAASKKFGSSSIWRSAVLPGYGQIYRGDRLRGGAFLGATLLTGYYYYSTYREYNSARLSYRQAGSLSPVSALSSNTYITAGVFAFVNQRRSRMQVQSARANFAAGLLLTTYLWNLGDAVIASRERGLSDASPPISATPAIQFAYSIRF